MSVNIRYPNITALSEKEQIKQIKSYLRQLVEQLNYALPTLGAVDGIVQTTSSSTYEVQGGELSYYELRSLLIQELQKINTQFDQLSQKVIDDALAAVDEVLEEAKASGEFDGQPGEPGADGISVTHAWEGTILTVTSASGTSSADLKGEKGEPGEQGADGYTPVKGVDYYTEEDKTEMVNDVLAALSSEAYDAGYEAGKQDGIQSEYDRFWDEYQAYAVKYNDYGNLFSGSGWTAETFRPKYDIVIDGGNRVFAYMNLNGSLKKALADSGVSMRFNEPYNINSTFEGASITEIGECDFSGSSRLNCTNIFTNCRILVTIDKVIPPVGQTTFSSWFYNCLALENVVFEGTIGANGLDLHWSTLLTHDSLMSIINALADYSEDTSGTAWAVTLGTTNLAKLTDAEKAIATQKGWTLA